MSVDVTLLLTAKLKQRKPHFGSVCSLLTFYYKQGQSEQLSVAVPIQAPILEVLL
jgi:hypothetical protein